MSNSIDFRADQIQTKQIIVTGSGAGTTKLLIYGIEAQGSPVNEGEIDTNVFPQDGIGGDVFLYVSGALNTKDSATVRGTSVFGGDLVVSGSLYNGSPAPAPAIRGIYSHAEGLSTFAIGSYSHAEGSGSNAYSIASHAEGRETIAYSDYSHAEGYLTRAENLYAHAEGYLTTGSGEASHAEGISTTASGKNSHAEGSGSIASGGASHAEGRETRAQGLYSHAEGYGGAGYASGNYSHAEGQATIASGAAAHAEGYQTNASGDYCHAEGQDTHVTTNGDWGHAEGQLTKVDNGYAHAEGYGTLASGLYSHAEGYLTTGSGEASHAEGISTTAGGAYSHAEGYRTATTGAYSHAQGSGSIAWGIYSFAAGNRTIASGSVDVTQAAFGRFNKRGNTTSLFVVGNGTGDSDALRGDIFRAESTGELVLSGGIRHSFRSPTTSVFITLTRSDYMVVVNTFTIAANTVVYLPVITDPVADVGLTVIINHYDVNASSHKVGIEPGNAGYEISGFDLTFSVGPSRFVLNTLGATESSLSRRSVTLTFVGLRAGVHYWAIMQHSAC